MFPVTVKYIFFPVGNAVSLEEGALRKCQVSPEMQKSQYLKILYEHSLEYNLILFKRAFLWLSWTIDRTQERKRRKGLGRRLLHSR